MSIIKATIGDRDIYHCETASGDKLFCFGDIRNEREYRDHTSLLKTVEDNNIDVPELREVLIGSLSNYAATHFNNIREMLGGFIGKTITDITQMDDEEFEAGEEPYVMLMFDDGSTLKTQMFAFESFNAKDNSRYSLTLVDEGCGDPDCENCGDHD